MPSAVPPGGIFHVYGQGLDWANIRFAGFNTQTIPISDNELAKMHVRHTVGGRAPASVDNEILYRFEFPERPGALMKFLENMSAGWNISLFHYRNHGADFGRVLVGFQVPPNDLPAFDAFLAGLGYPFRDERDNPAYRLFLA